ncbi:hypothetical protein ACHAWO_008703, partial [Cyclotella atomus]
MKHQHRHRGSIVAAIAVVFLCRHLLYCHGVTIEEGEGAPIQTVQFTPNVTHRTDMCDKQRLFRGGLIEVALIYNDAPGLIVFNEDTGDFDEDYPGFQITLLDELARRAGFEWRYSWGVAFPAHLYDGYRLQPNATADDILLWTVNAYDVSLTMWDATLNRLKLGITFPGKFVDTSTVLVATNADSREQISFDAFAFLKPFSIWVWVCTIITIVFTSMAAIGQVMFEPTRHGERILVISLSFWSLILVSTYTANLAGFLISERQQLYPASSLAEAERKQVPICIAANMSISSKTKAKYPNANYVDVEFNSRYDHLMKNDCSLVVDGYDSFKIAERNESYSCSLVWVGRVEDRSQGGPATIVDTGDYCTSLISHVIDFYLNEMNQDGYIEDAVTKFRDSISSYQCPEESDSYLDLDDTFRLTMKDMGSIFLWHFVFVQKMPSITNGKTSSMAEDPDKKLIPVLIVPGFMSSVLTVQSSSLKPSWKDKRLWLNITSLGFNSIKRGGKLQRNEDIRSKRLLDAENV